MWFWWFLIICDSLIPLTMLIGGRIMWKHCPKQINGLIGYRTTMSMKNMDTWKFAHAYVGKLWWHIGLILLIPTILLPIPFYHANENTLGFVNTILIVIQLVFLIGSIFPTEKALKHNFDKNGIRKDV